MVIHAGGSTPTTRPAARELPVDDGPNCPRCIHDYRGADLSSFVPRIDDTPTVPASTRFDLFREALSADDSARSPDAVPRDLE